VCELRVHLTHAFVSLVVQVEINKLMAAP